MKKLENPKKKILFISILSTLVLCVAVILGVFFVFKDKNPDSKKQKIPTVVAIDETAYEKEQKGGVIYLADNDDDALSFYHMSGGSIINSSASVTLGGAVFVGNGATFEMSGGTIQGCTSSLAGGAIYVANGGTCRITGGTITGQNTEKTITQNAQYGGGIYVAAGGTLIINSAVIQDCQAVHGGGIYLEENANMEVADSSNGTYLLSIKNNKATGSGGGLCGSVDSSEMTFKNIIFENNEAGTSGGGLELLDNACYDLYLENLHFKSNKSILGGASCFNLDFAALYITSCVIDSNTCTGENACGAGLYIATGQNVEIDNNTIISNNILTGSTRGGAGVAVSTMGSESANINIKGKIINNISNNNGGGLYIDAEGSLLSNFDVYLLGAEITGNRANGSNGGGVYYSNLSDCNTLTISENDGVKTKISSNYAYNQGGGIWANASKVSNVNIDNLELTNNVAYHGRNETVSTKLSTAAGGGLYFTQTITNKTNITFGSNCVVKQNDVGYTEQGGGAIWVKNANLSVDCDVSDNWSYLNGGGIMNNSGSIYIGEVTIDKNVANRNFGGGIYSVGGTISLDGTTIDQNEAGFGGGLAPHSSCIVNFSGNVKITNNTAKNDGGGLRYYGSVAARKLTIPSNVEFSGNGAKNGGAISLIFANAVTTTTSTTFNLSVDGVSFKNNTATGNGGAIYMPKTNLGAEVYVPVTISNSEFTSNSASSNGGAIWTGGKVTITSATFTSNSASSNGGAILSNGDVSITSATFDGNSVSSSETAGVFCGGTFTNSGSLVMKNHTTGNALYVKNITDNTFTSRETYTSTFTNNKVGLKCYGGSAEIFKGLAFNNNTKAIYFYGSGSSLILRDVTFSGNGTCIDAYAGVSVRFVLSTLNAGSMPSNNIIFDGTNANLHFSGSSNVYTGLKYPFTISGGSLEIIGGTYVNANNFIYASNADLTLNSITINNPINYAICVSESSLDITESIFIECNYQGSEDLSAYGGAISDESNSDITIENTLFRDCSSPSGGAIWSRGLVKLYNVNFENCSATENGGAVYLSGATLLNSGSSFDGCTAVNYGGAIYATRSTITSESLYDTDGLLIAATEFNNCSSTTKSGGAIALYNSSTCSLTEGSVDSCSATNGGAVYQVGSSSLTLSNVEIKNCSATTGSGGAVYSTSTNLFVNYSTIKTCYSSGSGGAIYHNGKEININQSTFIYNIAGANGGAVSLTGTGDWDGSTSDTYVNINISGTFRDNYANSNGGALHIARSSSATTDARLVLNSNTSFKCNGAQVNGSAVNVSRANVIVNGATFDENYAAKNGALSVSGAADKNYSFEMNSGSFINNYGTSGAGLFLIRVNAIINDGTFTNNNATNQGGAVHFSAGAYNSGFRLDVFGGTYSSNTGGTGGAFYSIFANVYFGTASKLTTMKVNNNGAYTGGGGFYGYQTNMYYYGDESDDSYGFVGNYTMSGTGETISQFYNWGETVVCDVLVKIHKSEPQHGRGAGIYIRGKSDGTANGYVEIHSGNITNNYIDKSVNRPLGGGFYIAANSTAKIYGGQIKNNKASNAFDFETEEIDYEYSSVSAQGAQIFLTASTSTLEVYGGSIYASDANLYTWLGSLISNHEGTVLIDGGTLEAVDYGYWDYEKPAIFNAGTLILKSGSIIKSENEFEMEKAIVNIGTIMVPNGSYGSQVEGCIFLAATDPNDTSLEKQYVSSFNDNRDISSSNSVYNITFANVVSVIYTEDAQASDFVKTFGGFSDEDWGYIIESKYDAGTKTISPIISGYDSSKFVICSFYSDYDTTNGYVYMTHGDTYYGEYQYETSDNNLYLTRYMSLTVGPASVSVRYIKGPVIADWTTDAICYVFLKSDLEVFEDWQEVTGGDIVYVVEEITPIPYYYDSELHATCLMASLEIVIDVTHE